MATSIYIYSKLSSPALKREGRSGLEDDLDEFLSGVGEVTGGGSAIKECAWNVDLELTEDSELEIWVGRLKQFLQKWGVPADTYFTIYPDEWEEGMETRRVNVFES